MTSTQTTRGRFRDIQQTRAGAAALVFVLLTMAALVLVPVLVQRRVNALRAEIEAAEPARTALTRLQFSMVREMASLTEILLTGDPAYRATFRSALEAERATLAELHTLAVALGPEIVAKLQEVRGLAEEWHTRAADDEILRRRETSPVPPLLRRERRLFEEVLRSTMALDSLIVRAAAENEVRIRSAERTGLALTFLMGILAFIAAATVAALDARVRRGAREVDQRREEAETALAELARANEARTRLLRGVSHDVKNPLGAAMGYAELLAMEVRAPLHPDQRPLVEGVQRSVHGALAILTDLLDVSRADSGGLSIAPVPADLVEIARNAVEDHRGAAEAAGHTVVFRPPAESLPVRTDPTRVQQVLGNLLSNAVKYTPAPGRIEVDLEPDLPDQAAAGGWTAVRVIDTGPGIPPDQREAIFDEFVRLDSGSEVKGHGLGLAIARRIARLLGGDLTVADAPRPGACFVLRLPAHPPEPSEPSSADPATSPS